MWSGMSEIGEPCCVLIPAGYFQMGCATGRDDEQPVHRVWIDAFEMAVFQVRNRDWAVFMEAAGHPAPPEGQNPAFNHIDQPVVAVNWAEANQYCRWLGRLSGRQYRLPTEAEWERAAKGGREDALYPWGDEQPEANDEYIRRWKRKVSGPLPVGQGTPNPFGLYDMGENVHEWCADWYSSEYYTRSPSQNPEGPPSGERRASRGGAWRHHIKASRCAARSSIPPDFRYTDYGFRVVRNIS
ncbi:MAG: formylglycine-generating enzyme family protein [Acidobacteria bacterium]|nr:MAG: formylglycine-generating enzyme family protein [Acidobacteriota bacterium]